jgi:mannosyl-oligosaccharide alpha-1,2-mannosidase
MLIYCVISFIVDCIDSLQIFRLEEEYTRARDWIANKLSFDVGDKHHAFEV